MISDASVGAFFTANLFACLMAGRKCRLFMYKKRVESVRCGAYNCELTCAVQNESLKALVVV